MASANWALPAHRGVDGGEKYGHNFNGKKFVGPVAMEGAEEIIHVQGRPLSAQRVPQRLLAPHVQPQKPL